MVSHRARPHQKQNGTARGLRQRLEGVTSGVRQLWARCRCGQNIGNARWQGAPVTSWVSHQLGLRGCTLPVFISVTEEQCLVVRHAVSQHHPHRDGQLVAGVVADDGFAAATRAARKLAIGIPSDPFVGARRMCSGLGERGLEEGVALLTRSAGFRRILRVRAAGDEPAVRAIGSM